MAFENPSHAFHVENLFISLGDPSLIAAACSEPDAVDEEGHASAAHASPPTAAADAVPEAIDYEANADFAAHASPPAAAARPRSAPPGDAA